MNIARQVERVALDEISHVEQWLAAFESALAAGDRAGLDAIIADECHWRDLLAFTWTISPHDDRSFVIDDLLRTSVEQRPALFRLATDRTAPRLVKRHGRDSIEGFFTFETKTGRGSGVVRLLAAEPQRAWVIATSLDELKGHEEPIGDRRPSGDAYSRTFGGENWSDLRRRRQAFEDREPAVLIIGSGQAGLAIAARLGLLGVDTLIVDKRARVGDIWRERYHSLALHNQVKLNHMPYLPWPPHWPKYLPKDMIAGWLENYAWAMECNVWTSTEFLGASFDEESEFWRARVCKADGTERILKPRHLIFANGIAGRPTTPKLPGLDAFEGEVIHTHAYRDGGRWRGKKVLVIGAGTSGHDVAQDLQGHGADVKIVQRGSTTVASVKAAGLVHSVYYEDDIALAECDMIAAAGSYPLLVKGYQAAVEKMKVVDQDMLEGLAAKGFKYDWGDDNTGHQMKFRKRHGGYYLNCGCSELIISGEVGLLQNEEIERFLPEGALLKDGAIELADLIVTATGYESQEQVIREMLGDDIAEKVGQIWGLAPNGELSNMFVATPQQGLWFSGGGFAQARIYSQYIALAIKGRELGLVS